MLFVLPAKLQLCIIWPSKVFACFIFPSPLSVIYHDFERVIFLLNILQAAQHTMFLSFFSCECKWFHEMSSTCKSRVTYFTYFLSFLFFSLPSLLNIQMFFIDCVWVERTRVACFSSSLPAKVAIGYVHWIIHETYTVTLWYFLKLLLTWTPLSLSIASVLFFTFTNKEKHAGQWEKNTWPMVSVLTLHSWSQASGEVKCRPANETTMQCWLVVFTLSLIASGCSASHPAHARWRVVISQCFTLT